MEAGGEVEAGGDVEFGGDVLTEESEDAEFSISVADLKNVISFSVN